MVATDVDARALREMHARDGWAALAARSDALVMQVLDVRSPVAWTKALERAAAAWGGLDTLINFAGLLIPAGTLTITPESIDAHVDVMVKGVMHGTAAAAKGFQAQPNPAHGGHGGHIVNVSSLGAVAPVAGVALYQAAKAGCRTFSLAAAKDLAPHGIAVSVLMPDAVRARSGGSNNLGG